MHPGRAWERICSKLPGDAGQADTLISQATGSHSIPKLEVISPAPRLSHFAHVTHGDSSIRLPGVVMPTPLVFSLPQHPALHWCGGSPKWTASRGNVHSSVKSGKHCCVKRFMLHQKKSSMAGKNYLCGWAPQIWKPQWGKSSRAAQSGSVLSQF